MDSVEYEGFLLIPKTYQLAETERWALAVHIMRYDEVRPYSASNTFPSREEAVRASIQFGRDIIDGKVASISSLDLPGR